MNDFEQLAALRKQGDPTVRLDDKFMVTRALMQEVAALRAENALLLRTNKRLWDVAWTAEEVIERSIAGQIPRHVVIDQLIMALRRLDTLGGSDHE